jgi:hypothetical protein
MALALFLSTMLAASTAAPAAPEGRAAPDAPPIVITGKRLDETEAALRACLARKCPPDEDIAATLAHAENLFVAGEYRRARSTLRSSLARNHDEARRYPEPVSNLYRANAVVANHLGFEEDYFQSTWGILRALKEGIPEPDARHFGARMEIAAMTMRLRGFEDGQHLYEELAKDADKAGRHDIAAMARLRAAGVAHREIPSKGSRKRLAEMAGSALPDAKAASLLAKLWLARIAREQGKVDEADAIIREVAPPDLAKPILVYSPPYQLTVQEMPGAVDPSRITAGEGNPARRFGGNFDGMWVDVGFWVQPDGRISDLEVLRKGGKAGWADPLLKSIRGRLYVPTREPFYRVERYTYTAGYEMRAGSHMMQRSPRARVEYLDLTLAGSAPPS